ncbi:unnamed protein product [Prorocentrum cordatum]|uniref:Uncharacterized protein n=1 Tax=Prorocentrum cordatum TaxID=2364126 RepID=A0ABN9RFM6_9DINO|nr:unnamed protein product [Polarella glacialis]
MLFNPLRRRTIAPQRSRRSSHAPCLPLENELLGRAREPPPSGGAAHVGRRGLSSAHWPRVAMGGASCAAVWKGRGLLGRRRTDAGRGEEGEKEQELRSERAAFARERHGCTAKPKAAWRSDTLSQSYRPRGPHCQAAPRPGRAAPRPAVGQPKHRGPIAPVSLPLIWARRANQRSPPHHSEQRGARRSTLTREGRLQEASTKCPGNEPAQRQLSGPRSGLPAARQPSQRSDSFPRPTATSVVDLCQTRMMS